jgi:hypothetical protein
MVTSSSRLVINADHQLEAAVKDDSTHPRTSNTKAAATPLRMDGREMRIAGG